MTQPSDYIALNINYGELLLIPFEHVNVLPKLRFANTTWASDTKRLEIKERAAEFSIITAEQITVALATQKLVGETS